MLISPVGGILSYMVLMARRCTFAVSCGCSMLLQGMGVHMPSTWKYMGPVTRQAPARVRTSCR